MRIVSLLPSSTEILCALGYGDQIVGRSHECDFPHAVKRLCACSEPKINMDNSPPAVHRQEKDLVQDSLSVYRVDADKLKALKPDIIVTQDQCDVCSVSINDVEQAVSRWCDNKPQIVTLRTHSLDDFWKDVRHVAEVIGDPQKGEVLIKRCKERMSEVARKAASLNYHPNVLCLEWFDPLTSAGNWIPELVQILGGEDLSKMAGGQSRFLTSRQLKELDPDIIVTMVSGWDIQRSLEESYHLTTKAVWEQLTAVREGRVYVTDGYHFFNRPGPRLVESLEILAEIMYSQEFHFGHKGIGWQKLD